MTISGKEEEIVVIIKDSIPPKKKLNPFFKILTSPVLSFIYKYLIRMC